MKRLVLAALRFYKARVSPGLPPACRYTPTCSEYAIEAVEQRGVIVGSLLAARRLHTRAKTVHSRATTRLRLVCALHDRVPSPRRTMW